MHIRRILGLGGLIAAPAQAETSDFIARYPAPNREASFLRQIVVDRIAGQDGATFAFAVEAALASPAADGSVHFTVRSAASRYRNTQETAAVDGVITGTISTGVDEAEVKRARKRCVEYKDGKQSGKCVKEEYVDVRCTERVVTVEPSLRVTRVSDDRIVHSATYGGREEVIWCRGEQIPASVEEMVRRQIDRAAAEFRAEIAPRIVRESIRYREGRAGMPKEIAARFRAAVLDSERNPESACAEWAAIDRQLPRHPSVVFNLGLCAETAAQLTDADRHYRQVLETEPRAGDARAGIDRIAQRQRYEADAPGYAREGT